jgi:hypothetical protein
VRFHVLTVASMKMTVFWDAAPCSLIETDWCFRGAYCLQHQGLIEIDWCFRAAYCLQHHGNCPGGSKHLWNISQFLWDYTAQHPRRQSSSSKQQCFYHKYSTQCAVFSDLCFQIQSLTITSSTHLTRTFHILMWAPNAQVRFLFSFQWETKNEDNYDQQRGPRA